MDSSRLQATGKVQSMTHCKHCEYMQSVALPDHRTEIRHDAYREIERWGLDEVDYLHFIEDQFDSEENHDFMAGFVWSRYAWLRLQTFKYKDVATLDELITKVGNVEPTLEG